MAMKTSARLLILAAVAAFAAAPASAQTPAAASDSHVSGKSVFTTYCASCHGESGRGNGAVAIFLRQRKSQNIEMTKLGFNLREDLRRISGGLEVTTAGLLRKPLQMREPHRSHRQ